LLCMDILIRQVSCQQVTTQVKTGDQMGILGDDHSEETDGARKHLHFSIYVGEKMDYHGYIQTQEELSNWLNPLDFY